MGDPRGREVGVSLEREGEGLIPGEGEGVTPGVCASCSVAEKGCVEFVVCEGSGPVVSGETRQADKVVTRISSSITCRGWPIYPAWYVYVE